MSIANVSAMEPMLPSVEEAELTDLAFELIQKSASLTAPLPTPVQQELGRLVRSMNCYYSNLIEGHQTHPRDIERALARDLDVPGRKRDLQEEAVAHIAVQTAIDTSVAPTADWPISEAYVRWIHREFCRRLPDRLLWVQSQDSERQVAVIPGEFREDIVDVGRHRPPPPSLLSAFINRFERAYAPGNLSKVQQLLSSAAAHHRLLWIHPFVDGNGRVARLMSHALLLRLEVGSSLWSISRGLARNVESYKSHLAAADASRHGDYDGRGALSYRALKEFCRFFLATCIDQVDFMRTLVQPIEIVRRIEIYVSEEIHAKRLPKGSFEMLREAFYKGEVARGRAPELTGYEERRARETVSTLLEKGLLISKGPRASLTIGFPMFVLERWLPALYPAATATLQ
jgi:Fic family protein